MRLYMHSIKSLTKSIRSLCCFRANLLIKMNYFSARRDDSVVDDYHGRKVNDPYRWLEDPDAEETKSFVEAQNKISLPYIDSYPHKEEIKTRLTELWNYPRYGCPSKRGSRYFYNYNSGLQNQSVTYVLDKLDGESKVFFDPNELSADGTISVQTSSFSKQGDYYAYALSQSGSDWSKIKIRNVETGLDLDETLDQCRYTSITWTEDQKGIFYSRYLVEEGIKSDGTETTSCENHKLFYHRLGTNQSQDILCAEFLDHPKWRIHGDISECGRYVIIYVYEGCKDNLVYYCDLQSLPNGIDGKLPLKPLVEEFEAEYDCITTQDSIWTFRTNKNSPRYRLFNVDINNPQEDKWVTLVEEHSKDVLNWACCVRDNLLLICYNRDVKDILQIHQLQTGEFVSSLPLEVGSVAGFFGRKELNEIFYHFYSFLTPGIIYRCDLTDQPFQPQVFKKTTVPGFDPSNFKVEQVFYSSNDGTKIPMYILAPKEFEKNGTAACYLYGYGGFNISIMPSFSVTRLLMLSHLGLIVAVANIRGGGEYGEDWHNGGRLFNKQNVFDDFHSAAIYLNDNKYASHNRITIAGGSNGGLLVGACINQKPQLYGCAVAHVGVMDMLRFHKFTVGHAWTSDYGCSDDAKHFQNLIKYSPLHNVNIPEGSIQYPSTLLLTADHDDRVVPLHSLKLIAQLQYSLGKESKQKNPLVIWVDTEAGHGAGKPTHKRIEEETYVISFIAKSLGLKFNN
ncbi:hypothetical protein CHUAL_008975 [Chamberlinius hualienensis]